MKQSKYKFSGSKSTSAIFPFNYEKITQLGKMIEKTKKHFYIFLRKTHKQTSYISNKSECVPLLSQLGFIFVHRIIERFPIQIFYLNNETDPSFGEYLVIEGMSDISGIFSSLPDKFRKDIVYFEINQIQYFNITRTSSKQRNICDYRILIETASSKNAVSFSICKFKDYFSILELAQTNVVKLKFSRVRPVVDDVTGSIKIPVSVNCGQNSFVSTTINKSINQDSPTSIELKPEEDFDVPIDSKSYITLGKELIFERVDYFFYLKMLVEGKEFIKYSTRTLKLRARRRLFFTGDLEYLCWAKPFTNTIKKKFKASEIQGCSYGRTTTNFMRFSPSDTFSLRNSFSILLASRSIDLEAYYYDDLRDFCKAIYILPELSKIHLL
jgi:hypothetical protein